MSETTLKELQKASSSPNLVLSVSILFVAGMAMGGSYVYGGLTLEAHMDEDDKTGDRAFIQLSQEEASWYISLVHTSYLSFLLCGPN